MSSPGASTEFGLVVALPAEAHCMGFSDVRTGECVRWRGGWFALSGTGPCKAAAAAERLLARSVRGLVNWGVAGALDPALRPGDVLIPDRVLEARDEAGFVPDSACCGRLVAALQGSMHVTRGALWSAAEPVTARADRRALAERSGAIAVDMEAAAVAGVAARANLPFAAVKAICDPLERELPVAAIRAFAGTNGALEPHLLPRLLLGGPALWLDLARLARDFAAARRALAAAANIALHDRIAA